MVAMRNGRSAMIHVLAFITTLPGKRDEVLAAFAANVPAVRAEDGCIEYGAATDIDVFGGQQAMLGPEGFVVIEKWASAEALRAHLQTAHMKAYSEKTKALLAARVLNIVEPI
jgi:quinol monooxygenase YgiN